ncbi:MAG: thioredoxin-disulfide reductase [Candidatus Onthoplasma sp.]
MEYDVVIVGGGPAGLTAGIYVSRAGLKTLCLEGLAVGGQASLSHDIENYPGYESISGYELTQKMENQAVKLGMELKLNKAQKIKKQKNGFVVETNDEKFFCKKLILATGCKARRLGLENEEQFIGRGVSYCATCDGNFFKKKNVAVVGGGNTAVQDVEYLSRIASNVVMINRSENFRAESFRIDEIKKLKNVKILVNSNVKKLIGNAQLEEIEIDNNGEEQKLEIDGLFVAVGQVVNLPEIDFDLEKDKNGYIVVDRNQQTSVKNVFACGDVTSKEFKQIITACADGARAGNSCIWGCK